MILLKNLQDISNIIIIPNIWPTLQNSGKSLIILNNSIMLCLDKIFNFLGGVPKFIETSIHSYIPFPNFVFGQIHFCIFTGLNFIETHFNPL
jgi:hypothetical protein